MSENTVKTGTLHLADTDLYYEVRGSGPWLALLGAPMEAAAFTPLAELLATNHTVLTMDPRGVAGSQLADPETDSSPELRAADLARVLEELKVDTLALFGSSGGAVTTLAFAEAYPDRVHTVIAHEPPLVELLADREQQRVGTEQIITAFKEQGSLAAWTEFFRVAGLELPPEVMEQMFGGEQSAEQLAEHRHFFLHEMKATTHWQPNLQGLREGGTRIMVGLGEESVGQLCDRTSQALAAGLDADLVSFAGDHTGFVDHPEAFAERLNEVLAGQ
ncbi:alpha/beta fold hydrolase [Psychromicrobium lacuslunae]|uniref:Hydrolase n=1 Tax=Psychromicrobium lacuslunae TaxID=1618207 RepID=A0A0D4BXN3_9MICC|nr:alpha/beta hydrolase [Psychromicrobium lacuslunae]AJT41054.1 hydrolase [Psychromicrobium lacuslunae]